MIPTFIRTDGSVTCEQIAPDAFILRGLINPENQLGKFWWVCNLIRDGSKGYIKAFLGKGDLLASDGKSLIRIGRSLGIKECEVDHLDDEGNLIVQKKLWKAKHVRSN